MGQCINNKLTRTRAFAPFKIFTFNKFRPIGTPSPLVYYKLSKDMNKMSM